MGLISCLHNEPPSKLSSPLPTNFQTIIRFQVLFCKGRKEERRGDEMSWEWEADSHSDSLFLKPCCALSFFLSHSKSTINFSLPFLSDYHYLFYHYYMPWFSLRRVEHKCIEMEVVEGAMAKSMGMKWNGMERKTISITYSVPTLLHHTIKPIKTSPTVYKNCWSWGERILTMMKVVMMLQQ